MCVCVFVCVCYFFQRAGGQLWNLKGVREGERIREGLCVVCVQDCVVAEHVKLR